MIKIKILSGIPACGKTIFSREYVNKNANSVRINRDDLRESLINNIYTDGNENFVNKAKMALIGTAIENDKDMILDDTHCYEDYLKFLIGYIKSVGEQLHKQIHIEILDFNIDLDKCLDRNDRRDGNIPRHMVLHMFNEKKKIKYTDLDIDKYTIFNDEQE